MVMGGCRKDLVWWFQLKAQKIFPGNHCQTGMMTRGADHETRTAIFASFVCVLLLLVLLSLFRAIEPCCLLQFVGPVALS